MPTASRSIRRPAIDRERWEEFCELAEGAGYGLTGAAYLDRLIGAYGAGEIPETMLRGLDAGTDRTQLSVRVLPDSWTAADNRSKDHGRPIAETVGLLIAAALSGRLRPTHGVEVVRAPRAAAGRGGRSLPGR